MYKESFLYQSMGTSKAPEKLHEVPNMSPSVNTVRQGVKPSFIPRRICSNRSHGRWHVPYDTDAASYKTSHYFPVLNI